VYDRLLGGHESFAADRERAAGLPRICLSAGMAAFENRYFLARAVTWAAGQGLTQFVDLGAGPPVRKAKARVLEDIHVTAQAANSSARVAYVDNDRVVVAHSRAFRAPAKGVAVAGVIRAAYIAGDSVPRITAGPCTSRRYGRRRQRFELPPGVVRDPADHAVQQAALGRVERALLRAVTWHGVRPTRAGLLAAIRLPDGSEFPIYQPRRPSPPRT
jgi:hypothetical protein